MPNTTKTTPKTPRPLRKGMASAKPAPKSRIFSNVTAIQKNLVSPPSLQKISPSYHRIRNEAILAQLIKIYRKTNNNPVPLLGKTLLDAGCGTTPIGCMMALAGAEVTAIDPNPSALQACATDADNFGTPLTFLAIKAEKLIASPQRYDVILALDVLAEHPQPLKFLWVLRELLTPGGILVIGHTTRSVRAWLMHVFLSQIVLKRVPVNVARWRKFHTPEQLDTLAKRAGLMALGSQLLRYSLHGMRWKLTNNRHRSTRYLNFYRAAD